MHTAIHLHCVPWVSRLMFPPCIVLLISEKVGSDICMPSPGGGKLKSIKGWLESKGSKEEELSPKLC